MNDKRIDTKKLVGTRQPIVYMSYGVTSQIIDIVLSLQQIRNLNRSRCKMKWSFYS